jgi:hypothetical protein
MAEELHARVVGQGRAAAAAQDGSSGDGSSSLDERQSMEIQQRIQERLERHQSRMEQHKAALLSNKAYLDPSGGTWRMRWTSFHRGRNNQEAARARGCVGGGRGGGSCDFQVVKT